MNIIQVLLYKSYLLRSDLKHRIQNLMLPGTTYNLHRNQFWLQSGCLPKQLAVVSATRSGSSELSSVVHVKIANHNHNKKLPVHILCLKF